MKRVLILKLVALSLCSGLAPTLALAQSVEIPLNYALNSGYSFGSKSANSVLILTINVGVNGGAAQPYVFDTGSAVFLTPSGVFGGSASSTLASGVNIDTYGGASTFSGNVYQTTASSLQFYATPGTTSGGISLGTSGNYNVASYTEINGATPPAMLFGTAAVGVFGAAPAAIEISGNGTQVPIGNIFGQTVLPNTTAGYVVSANGQSLSALNAQLNTSIAGGPVGGAQQLVKTVPQSMSSCNPCVTVGLTPALTAQFLPVNIVKDDPSGNPFPNSNVQGIGKFVPFNFTLSSGSGNSEPLSLKVSLDTGWGDLYLNTGSLKGYQNPILTVSANSNGTRETFDAINNTYTPRVSGVPSPYSLVNSSSSSENYLGIGFFIQNSVLYNLSGEEIGYSPNFVTAVNVTTTGTSPLVINSTSVPLGLAGDISGPGGVSITGSGSAAFSGANTYTGTTSITNGGYLALIGPGSIAASSNVTVSSGGLFDISGAWSDVAIQSLAGDQNGLVNLGANTLFMTNANGTYAGVITGSGGLTLTGGVETLAGINTYTGATTVDGGMLVINSVLAGTSNVTVNAGGTLAGSGTIDPQLVTIGSGGILAPGKPGMSGTSMMIIGNLGFQPGATYMPLIGPGGVSTVNASGTASLAGTLTPIFISGPLTKGITILTSSGLSGTTFSSFNTADVPESLTASVSYDSDDVYLSFTSHMAAIPGLTGNQHAIAQTLDNFFNDGPLPPAFGSVYGLGGSNLANALSTLSGESTTGAQQGAFQLMDSFLGIMLDPFVDGRNGANSPSPNGSTALAGESGSSQDSSLAYASESNESLPPELASAYAVLKKPAPDVPQPSRWNVWGAAYGGSLSLSANGSASGAHDVSAGIYGAATGADYHATRDTAFGFAVAGGGTDWSLSNGLGGGHSTAMQAGVYASTQIGAAYVASALAFTNYWLTSERGAFGGDQLGANFGAQSFGGRTEAGYRVTLPASRQPAVTVAPYVAIQPQLFQTPVFSETDLTGTGFGLTYQASDAVDTRTEFGSRVTTLVALPDGMAVNLWSRAAWAHDFVENPVLTAGFQSLPGTSFVVYGARPADNSALVSVGSELYITPALSLLVKFDGQFAGNEQVAAGNAALRFAW